MYQFKQILTIVVIVMALMAAMSAQAALYCNGTSECDTKAIGLIKRATKAGCDASALANDLGSPKMSADEFDGNLILAIETCIEKAKYAKSLEKKQAKRAERIQKALGK